MRFDGVDDWVGLSSSYSFESHLTFQAWIKPSSEGDFNGNDAGKCIYAQGAQAGASWADFAVGLMLISLILMVN